MADKGRQLSRADPRETRAGDGRQIKMDELGGHAALHCYHTTVLHSPYLLRPGDLVAHDWIAVSYEHVR